LRSADNDSASDDSTAKSDAGDVGVCDSSDSNEADASIDVVVVGRQGRISIHLDARAFVGCDAAFNCYTAFKIELRSVFAVMLPLTVALWSSQIAPAGTMMLPNVPVRPLSPLLQKVTFWPVATTGKQSATATTTVVLTAVSLTGSIEIPLHLK
jgi:hypothetical protein